MSRVNLTEDIGLYRDGYLSNVPFPPDATEAITLLQQSISEEAGPALWPQPKESLHMTLFDFIAPRTDYGQSHSKMYHRDKKAIHDVMLQLANEFHAFTVTFDEIKLSESAIYLHGKDSGETARIRARFLDLYDLDPRTKQPPVILHATLFRFIKPIDLVKLEGILSSKAISVTIPVDYLRLVHEEQIPMLQYKVLSEYLLQ